MSNLKTAQAHAESVAGIAPGTPSDQRTHRQRYDYTQALAGYVLEHPEQFGEGHIRNAKVIRGIEFEPVETYTFTEQAKDFAVSFGEEGAKVAAGIAAPLAFGARNIVWIAAGVGVVLLLPHLITAARAIRSAAK